MWDEKDLLVSYMINEIYMHVHDSMHHNILLSVCVCVYVCVCVCVCEI